MLNNNLLTGPIPTTPACSLLDLSRNQLTGPLSNVGTVSPGGFTYLSVADNLLTGQIPASFGSLTALQVLDVSDNALTGPLPDLSSLDSLLVLICGENDLTGLLVVPNAASMSVVLAQSNSFSQLDTASWCETDIGMRCALTNNHNPSLNCSLTCPGGETRDLVELCDMGCSCPDFAELSSHVDTDTILAIENMDLTSCSAGVHGDSCVYTCASGYEPSIISDVGTINNPTHVATCDGGSWSFRDSDNNLHGCVEMGCSALSESDLPYVNGESCPQPAAPGSTCTIICSASATVQGSGVATCTGGVWDIGDTVCTVAEDIYGNFNCKALTDSLIPNVNTSSCSGTPGRTNIGWLDSEPYIYNFNRDYLSLLGTCDPSRHESWDYASQCRTHPPGECEYACAPGYYPNDAERAVTCDLGKWYIPENATCTARMCDDLWTDWSECDGFCNGGHERRTFLFNTDSLRADAIASLIAGYGDCPPLSADELEAIADSQYVEERECQYRPRCCTDGASYAALSTGTATVVQEANCNVSAGGLAFGVLKCTDFWGDWGPCSRFCDGGTWNRTFENVSSVYDASFSVDVNIDWSMASNFLDMECELSFGDIETQPCDAGLTGHVNCNDFSCYDFFSAWSECDRFCTGGSQTRVYVVPDDPTATAYDAEVCQGDYGQAQYSFPQHLENESKACETVAALGFEEGGYLRCDEYDCEDYWQDWSQCSHYCSGGTRTRTYTSFVSDPIENEYLQQVCWGDLSYPANETRDCFQDEYSRGNDIASLQLNCSCDSFWSEWGDCDALCYPNAHRTRTFTVDDDMYDAYVDEVCAYDLDTGTETELCAENLLPSCSWDTCFSFFSDWSECTKFCTNGTQTRTFSVPADNSTAVAFNEEMCQSAAGQAVYPFPQDGGVETAACETVAALGFATGGYSACNDFNCDDYWQPWQACNRQCSGGTRQRFFTVSVAAPRENAYLQEVCWGDRQYPTNETNLCPEDAYERGSGLNCSCASFWTEWSSCDAFCFPNGKRTRTFQVNSSSMEYAEEVCSSDLSKATEEQLCAEDLYMHCDMFSCDSFFGSWSSCNAYCASDNDGLGGTMSRNFSLPPNNASAVAYYMEMCDGKEFSVGSHVQTYPQDGGSQTVSCSDVPTSDGGGYTGCEAYQQVRMNALQCTLR